MSSLNLTLIQIEFCFKELRSEAFMIELNRNVKMLKLVIKNNLISPDQDIR